MITDRLGRSISIGDRIAIPKLNIKDDKIFCHLLFATVINRIGDDLEILYSDGQRDKNYSSNEFVIISSTLNPIVNFLEEAALGYVAA